MQRKKQLRNQILITVIGLVIFAVVILFYNNKSENYKSILDGETVSGASVSGTSTAAIPEIHKIEILAYEDAVKKELSKQSQEGQDTVQLAQEVVAAPYLVSVVQKDDVENVKATLQELEVSKENVSNEKADEKDKQYEVIAYDVNGAELQRVTLYRNFIQTDRLYKNADDSYANVFKDLCRTYNKPWVSNKSDSTFTFLSAKQYYESKKNAYKVDNRKGELQQCKLEDGIDKSIVKTFAIDGVHAIVALTDDKIFLSTSKGYAYVPYNNNGEKNDKLHIENMNYIVSSRAVTDLSAYADSQFFIYSKSQKLNIVDYVHNSVVNTVFEEGADLFNFVSTSLVRRGTDTYLATDIGLFHLAEGEHSWKRIDLGKVPQYSQEKYILHNDWYAHLGIQKDKQTVYFFENKKVEEIEDNDYFNAGAFCCLLLKGKLYFTNADIELQKWKKIDLGEVDIEDFAFKTPTDNDILYKASDKIVWHTFADEKEKTIITKEELEKQVKKMLKLNDYEISRFAMAPFGVGPHDEHMSNADNQVDLCIELKNKNDNNEVMVNVKMNIKNKKFNECQITKMDDVYDFYD